MSAATTQAGYPTRKRECEKHGGHVFYQICFPNTHPDPEQCWHGNCPLCEDEEKLERRASEILAGQDRERRRRINERYQPDEKQITEETDAAIEAVVQRFYDDMEANHRPEFEAQARRGLYEKAEQEVETEMLAEIVKELRQTPKAAA